MNININININTNITTTINTTININIPYHSPRQLDWVFERGHAKTPHSCPPPPPHARDPCFLSRVVLQAYLQQTCWTRCPQPPHVLCCCAALRLRPHAACLGLLDAQHLLPKMDCLASCLHWGSTLNMHNIFVCTGALPQNMHNIFECNAAGSVKHEFAF